MDFDRDEDAIRLLNRSVVLVWPKEPMQRLIEATHGIKILNRQVLQEGTHALLMPFFEDPDDSEAWVRENFAILFERQLGGWDIEPEAWPFERTWETFSEWFEVNIQQLTWDLVGTRLLYDWETPDDGYIRLPSGLDSVSGQQDLKGIFGSPNGSAYETAEVRIGPPLDYIAEKLRTAIVSAYNAVRSSLNTSGLEEVNPEVFRAVMRGEEGKGKNETCRCAVISFRFSLHAYLALQNMLAPMNQHDIIERLLSMTWDDLQAWLDRVTQEGSVTG